MDSPVARILEKTKELGIDQKTLASALGIRAAAVSEWKKGTNSSYTKYLPQLAEFLGTSVEWIMTGEDIKKEPATVEDDSGGLADKLAAALISLGVEVDRLSDADVLKVAKIVATFLDG